MIPCQEPLRRILTLMCKKIGILGALDIAVGILGAPCCLNFGSPKIRNDWSAPKIIAQYNLSPMLVQKTTALVAALAWPVQQEQKKKMANKIEIN